MELIQYNACLTLTVAVRRTSKKKFFEELDLESIQHHHLYRKLSYFYKFYKNELPQYVFKLIPVKSSGPSTRSIKMFLCSKQDKTFLKKYFFQSAIIQLDNLKIRNSSSLKTVSLNLSDYLLIVF